MIEREKIVIPCEAEGPAFFSKASWLKPFGSTLLTMVGGRSCGCDFLCRAKAAAQGRRW
jgi:hypothetical protein